MFMFRKNIILVPSDFDGISLSKGLLTLDCLTDRTECNLKVYNLQTERPLLLGIAINDELFKIEVKESQIKNFSFDQKKVINNSDRISCVLLAVGKDNYQTLLWGSTQLSDAWKGSLSLMIDDYLEQNKKQTNENKSQLEAQDEQVINSNNLCDNFENNNSSKEILKNNDIQSYLKEELFENADDYHNSGGQTNEDQYECKYQDNKNDMSDQSNGIDFKNESQDFVNDLSDNKTEIYSYEDEKINAFIDKVIDIAEQQEKSNIKQNQDDMTFYERINYQIEKMFSENREETVLNEILPNSKFVRVEFDDKSGYYVFGIIYDDGIPKYLCYGLPAKYGDSPPSTLSNLYQWLPLDTNDEFGDGYYMMYQDANNGKNISVEII